MKLGDRIKEIRMRKDMSLREMARRMGVSVGLLSQIETGRVYPSIRTLYKIAMVLNVPVGILFETEEEVQPLYIKSSKKEAIASESGFTVLGVYEFSKEGAATIMVLKAKPGEKETNKPHTHAGREFVYVLKGRVDFIIGEKSYHLGEGDILCFNSSTEHLWENNSDEEAELLWISHP